MMNEEAASIPLPTLIPLSDLIWGLIDDSNSTTKFNELIHLSAHKGLQSWELSGTQQEKECCAAKVEIPGSRCFSAFSPFMCSRLD